MVRFIVRSCWRKYLVLAFVRFKPFAPLEMIVSRTYIRVNGNDENENVV